jgi:aryl-alcohol dehydrogenase-like predicted oxidoreductase
MQRKPLGRTGVTVPVITMGTMTFGEQNTEAEGHAQLDVALAHGIDFLDTAELYSIPPKLETAGSTETIIGTWLKARGNRDKVMIATKMVGRTGMTWFRPNGEKGRITPEQIDYAVENSLRRLQTDHIDLYQMHWPDREIQLFGGFSYKDYAEDFTPFEIILEAMGRHVEKGNIRWIGVSNETAWGVMRFVAEAEKRGLPRIASIQNAYNLVNRTFETGLAECSMREDVSMLAYSPLGQGYLTGKYRNGALPAGSRKQLFQRLGRYEGPGADRAIQSYLDLSAERGLTPEQLAIKFCATRSFVTSTIIGATTVAQLEADIRALDAPWDDELEQAVVRLHATCPNPCP